MSNINANPPISPPPVHPLPAFSASPAKDFLLKSAIFLMASAALLLTGVVAWDGRKPAPIVINVPPNVVVNPPGTDPTPTPQPIPGPTPQPGPVSPPPQPQPAPQPQPSSPTLTVAAPGQTLIRVRVGSGPNSKIGFAAITFDQPGTYPVALEVVSDPANPGDGSQ